MKELRVRDLMTTQVITVRPTDTVKRATIKMAVDNVTGVPVVDNRNHILGILTENDILKLILKYQTKLESDVESHNLLNTPLDSEVIDPQVIEAYNDISKTTVEEIMVRTVLVTFPDEEIVQALKKMMIMNVNRLPVLEQGVLVGTISRSDVIFYTYKRKI